MPGDTYDYAVLRVVPRVERGEFLNAGIVLFCRTRRFLGVRVELDEERLQRFAPWADLDEVREHLAALERVSEGNAGAGPLGALSQAERFHWLVSPRSTVIQASPVHSGQTGDPEAELDHLMDQLVRHVRD